MKRFLWSSTGDLTSVFQRLQAFWRHQAEEISSHQQATGHKVAIAVLQPLFSKIRPNLARWPVLQIGAGCRAVPRNVAATDEKAEPPPGRCDRQHHCAFKSTLGLPCRHDIFGRLQGSARGGAGVIPFEMSEVDEFWHRQRPQRPDDVPQEPLPVRGKGRPKGSLNLEKTTRRDASEFEVVEAIERAEASPPSTAPAALPGTKKSTRKRKADGKAAGKGRGRPAAAAAIAATTSTARGLEYLRQHGDSYEPGTAAPRSWQDNNSDNELADETQGTIHKQRMKTTLWQATVTLIRWNGLMRLTPLR
ncbi:MULE transposase [Hirsutella rhossiliensis]